ncbi:MAG: DUF47 family protein [Bacteroidales bacterium]|jgi:uncharacterized protein Yka (UPF0111/DUF47 family)|nr:DUF47 family protein [Bacteroidales bacterium]
MSRNNLLNVFVPKYHSLFPWFDRYADNLASGGNNLKLLMQTKDREKQSQIISSIHDTEKAGERISHETYSLLRSLIVIPFDREDINDLINKSGHFLSMINQVARTFQFNKQERIFTSYAGMSDLIAQAADEACRSIKNLRDAAGNRHKISASCRKLNQLAKDAEEAYYEGIMDVFSGENSAKELTMRKNVLESFRKCISGIKDLNEALRTIIIKVS